VVLQLTRVHLVLWVVGWVLIQVWEEDGLAVGGLDVFSRAAVPVAARADLVVEGTVYFVGFGTEDTSEVVRHCGGCEVVVGRRICWRMDLKARGLRWREPCALK
jgi:hypothetical protein